MRTFSTNFKRLAKLKSKDYIDLEYKWSCHNYKPIPVVIEKGLGSTVWDVEGKKYFDFLSCYSAVNQGHCHPKIMKSMIDQLSNSLTLTSRAFYNNKFPIFAEYVCNYFGYESVLPSNSGAEAVEGAIKLARKWGYEKKGIPKDQAVIIACKDNFHGRTISIVSMSSDPDSHGNFGPLTPGLHQIEFNNAAELEKYLSKHGKNVAGFLVEPIQGEAGVVVPSEGYLKKCFEICKKYNVLFIADEIQTGLGRTGALLAVHHEDVRPDIVILGKAMSGGVYPVSCVLADRHIMDVIQPGQHGSTFAGNPLACTVAIASLEVLKEEGLVQKSKELGEFLLKELKPLVKSDGVLTLVRGKGLFAAMIVNHDHPGMNGHTAYDLCKLFKTQGLLAKQTHDTIIRLAPPLVITKEELSEGLNMIKKTIKGIETIGFKKYAHSVNHVSDRK
jgi:ornithine--oxo-acid transaminase